MTQKLLCSTITERPKCAVDHLAEAIESIQISTKNEIIVPKIIREYQPTGRPIKVDESVVEKLVVESSVVEEAEVKKLDVEKSDNQNERSQEKLTNTKNPKRLRLPVSRGQGGYPIKLKIEKDSESKNIENSKILDQTTQTEKAQWRNCSILKNPPPINALMDPKLRHLPLYWGASDAFFDWSLPRKPQPLMSLNYENYRTPDLEKVYYFNPPTVVRGEKEDERPEPTPLHSWLHSPRTAHPELILNVNSARRYLDSTPKNPQKIGKTLHNFNKWRRGQDAEDYKLHGWISSNLVDMDPHEFLERIDSDGMMRGRYSDRAVRRMQNWMDMHESWRDTFLQYPVILFFRDSCPRGVHL